MSDNNNDIEIERIYDRIERFLRNEMTDQEAAQFLSDLKSDPQLAEHARSMSVLIKSIKESGKANDMKIKDSILLHKRKSYKIIPLFVKVSGIAALIVLLLGISDFFIARNNTMTVAEEYMAFAPQYVDEDMTYRGTANDSIVFAELQPMFSAIQKGNDLEGTIATLKSLFEKSQSTETNIYSDYGDYIGYNLALAYLKKNEREEAKVVLKQLLRIYPDYEYAKELLKAIEDIKGIW